MIKEIRYVILKLREIYNRKMWCYCIGRAKKYECESNYKEMYIWQDKAHDHLEKQQFVTGRIRGLGL